MDGLIGKVGVVADGLKRMSSSSSLPFAVHLQVQVSALRWAVTL